MDKEHDLFSNEFGMSLDNAFVDIFGGDQKNKPQTRMSKTHGAQLFRRYKSELELENVLDWQFEQGCAYHVISSGDIDSLSFLKFILRQQPLKYCALSTWCMAMVDITELERYLQKNVIARLDCYVGEIFKKSYLKEWIRLCEVMREYNGRAAIFRNHSKVFCGFGDKFDFVIESSANINTNPRTENTVITIDSELALFYKQFFDGIISFERNFDDWKKYDLMDGEVNAVR